MTAGRGLMEDRTGREDDLLQVCLELGDDWRRIGGRVRCLDGCSGIKVRMRKRWGMVGKVGGAQVMVVGKEGALGYMSEGWAGNMQGGRFALLRQLCCCWYWFFVHHDTQHMT